MEYAFTSVNKLLSNVTFPSVIVYLEASTTAPSTSTVVTLFLHFSLSVKINSISFPNSRLVVSAATAGAFMVELPPPPPPPPLDGLDVASPFTLPILD